MGDEVKVTQADQALFCSIFGFDLSQVDETGHSDDDSRVLQLIARHAAQAQLEGVSASTKGFKIGDRVQVFDKRYGWSVDACFVSGMAWSGTGIVYTTSCYWPPRGYSENYSADSIRALDPQAIVKGEA